MTSPLVANNTVHSDPFAAGGKGIKGIGHRVNKDVEKCRLPHWKALQKSVATLNAAFEARDISYQLDIIYFQNVLEALFQEGDAKYEDFQKAFNSFANKFKKDQSDSLEAEKEKQIVLHSLSLKLSAFDYSQMGSLTTDLRIANSDRYITFLHLKALQLKRLATNYVCETPDLSAAVVTEAESNQLLYDIDQKQEPVIGVFPIREVIGRRSVDKPLTAEQREINFLIAEMAPSLGLSCSCLQLPTTTSITEVELMDFKHSLEQACSSVEVVELAHHVQVAHFVHPVSEITVTSGPLTRMYNYLVSSESEDRKPNLRAGSECLSIFIGKKRDYSKLTEVYSGAVKENLDLELTSARRSAQGFTPTSELIPSCTFRYRLKRYTLQNDGDRFWLEPIGSPGKRVSLTLKHIFSLLKQLEKQNMKAEHVQRLVKQVIWTIPESDIQAFINFSGAVGILQLSAVPNKAKSETRRFFKRSPFAGKSVLHQSSTTWSVPQTQYHHELVQRFKTPKYANALAQFQSDAGDKSKKGKVARRFMSMVGVKHQSRSDHSEAHHAHLQEMQEAGGSERLDKKRKVKIKASPERNLSLASIMARGSGKTAKMQSIALPLAQAIKNAEVQKVKDILNNRQVINAIMLSGGPLSVGSLLFSVCELEAKHQTAQLEIIQCFFKHFGASFTARNSKGETVLHIACRNNNPKLVEAILGRFPLLPTTSNLLQLTPLHVACMLGNKECVRLLYPKSNVRATIAQPRIMRKALVPYPLSPKSICVESVASHNRLTPFQIACLNGHLEVIKTILRQNPKAYKETTSIDASSVLLAVESGNTQLVGFLLSQYPEEARGVVNQADAAGRTPLLVAILNQNSTMTRYLLRSTEASSATPLAVGSKQWLPLELAFLTQNVDVLRELVASTRVDCNQKLSDDECLLHKIAQMTEHELALSLLEVVLTAEDINLDVRNAKDQTSTFVAALCHSPCSKRLNEAQPDVLADNTDTPLHLAVRRENLNGVKILLEEGSRNINVVNSDGKTALMLAVQTGNILIIEAVANCSAINLHRTDRSGRTVFHYAAELGQCNAFIFLMKKVMSSWEQELFDQHTLVRRPINFSTQIANAHTMKDCYRIHNQIAQAQQVSAPDLSSDGVQQVSLEAYVDDVTSSSMKNLQRPNLVDVLSVKDEQKCTPMHCAAMSNNEQAVSFLEACYEAKTEEAKLTLTEHAAIFEAEDHNGYTFVHKASQNPNQSALKWCDAQGLVCDIQFTEQSFDNAGEFVVVSAKEIPSSMGETLVHAAVRSEQAANVEFLKARMPLTARLANKQGVTPLHIAKKNRFTEIVTTLVLWFKNLFGDAKVQNYPLHDLIAKGMSLDEFKQNVEGHDALLNVRNENGDTLLHVALESGNIDIAIWLLRLPETSVTLHNANRQSAIDIVNIGLGCLDTPMGWDGCALSTKARSYDLLAQLIATKKFVLSASDMSDMMLYYTSEGAHQVVEALLEYAQDDEVSKCKPQELLGIVGDHQDSLLHIAIRKNNHTLVKVLVKHHIDIKKINQNKETALHLALTPSSYGSDSVNLEIVKELLFDSERVNIFATNIVGKTALHLAVESGNQNALTEVLKTKQIEFDYAVREIDGFEAEIRTDVGIDRRDKEGCTAAHIAMMAGNNSMLLLLREAGADLSMEWHEVSDDGPRVLRIEPSATRPLDNLELESSIKNHRSVKAVLNQTIKSAIEHPRYPRDANGNTALHILCNRLRRVPQGEQQLPYLAQINYLLSMPRYQSEAFINAKNKDGDTALHLAVRFGIVPLVQRFACVEVVNYCEQNAQGQTVAHLIASSKNIALTKELLQAMPLAVSADDPDRKTVMEIKDSEGNLPVHIACLHGNQLVVSMVEKYQPYLFKTTGKLECTPLMLALVNHHHGIFISLLTHFETDVSALWQAWPDIDLKQVMIEADDQEVAELNKMRQECRQLDCYLAAIAFKESDTLSLLTDHPTVIRHFNTHHYAGGNNLLHIAVKAKDFETVVHLTDLKLNGQASVSLGMFEEDSEDSEDTRGEIVFDDFKYTWEAPGENTEQDSYLYIEHSVPCFRLKQKNSNGRTVLHAAIEDGNYVMAQVFISRCTEFELTLPTESADSKTPLELAKAANMIAVEAAIKEKLRQLQEGDYTAEQEKTAREEQIKLSKADNVLGTYNNLELEEKQVVLIPVIAPFAETEAPKVPLATISELDESAARRLEEEYDVISSEEAPTQLEDTLKAGTINLTGAGMMPQMVTKPTEPVTIEQKAPSEVQPIGSNKPWTYVKGGSMMESVIGAQSIVNVSAVTMAANPIPRLPQQKVKENIEAFEHVSLTNSEASTHEGARILEKEETQTIQVNKVKKSKFSWLKRKKTQSKQLDGPPITEPRLLRRSISKLSLDSGLSVGSHDGELEAQRPSFDDNVSLVDGMSRAPSNISLLSQVSVESGRGEPENLANVTRENLPVLDGGVEDEAKHSLEKTLVNSETTHLSSSVSASVRTQPMAIGFTPFLQTSDLFMSGHIPEQDSEDVTDSFEDNGGIKFRIDVVARSTDSGVDGGSFSDSEGSFNAERGTNFTLSQKVKTSYHGFTYKSRPADTNTPVDPKLSIRAQQSMIPQRGETGPVVGFEVAAT